MESVPDTGWVTKNLRLGWGPRIKPNTTVPLKNCSNKVTPNGILLHS